MAYLSRGDTALSVAMTSVSTLLAPLLTPVLVLALAGQFLPVDARGLFVSIVQIVLAPVLVGLLLRQFVPRLVERSLDVMPLVSVVGITAVVMAVVAASASTLLTVGILVAVAVVAHLEGQRKVRRPGSPSSPSTPLSLRLTTTSIAPPSSARTRTGAVTSSRFFSPSTISPLKTIFPAPLRTTT